MGREVAIPAPAPAPLPHPHWPLVPALQGVREILLTQCAYVRGRLGPLTRELFGRDSGRHVPPMHDDGTVGRAADFPAASRGRPADSWARPESWEGPQATLLPGHGARCGCPLLRGQLSLRKE